MRFVYFIHRIAVRYGRPVAMVYYRDFTGIRRRLQASGATKAERRSVLKAVERAIAMGDEARAPPKSTLQDGARAWLGDFEALVSAEPARHRPWISTATQWSATSSQALAAYGSVR